MENKTIKQLFSDVLKRGKTYHSPHLSLKVLYMPDVKKSSFYFVVSGKITKKAVKRNLFKRRGRSITRASGAKGGCIGAFFAKKGAGALEFGKMKEEILDLMRKAKIVN